MTTRISWNPRGIKEVLFDFPMYIVTHPFKGFDEMKYLKRGDTRYAIFILALAGLVAIMRWTHTGFIVSGFWQATPFVPVARVLIFTYSPILLFCIANWSITTITDGKGTLKEIFLAYAYSMFPMVICTVIGIVLSNFVTGNEVAFARFFLIAGPALQYAYLFVGLIMIHEYTFLRAVLMVILTILAMLIITFVFALFFSLLSNVIDFISTISWELNSHWIG
ncbi:MAG: YIP1 family protein [Firmicutes bacterium]|nr:YIP1 family protein [Bacillota bacterium]